MIQTYLLDSAALPDPLGKGLPGAESGMYGLSAERMEKIKRIRHPGTRKQSFGAGLLTAYMLGRLAPGAVIRTNSYGKPACAGVPFNLSHTKDAVILSVMESGEGMAQPLEKDACAGCDLKGRADTCAGCGMDGVCIGCDIERIQPYEPRVAKRFFTAAEYQSLEEESGAEAQAELFYRYWTKKESVMKLTGLGIRLPMDLYDVRGSQVVLDTEKALLWHVKSKEHGNEEYAQAAEVFLHQKLFFEEYRYKEYCITVCSISCRFAPEISIMEFEGGQKLRLKEKIALK